MQALLFDPNKLAPTYPASMILRPPKFNAYYDVMDVKPVNGATWRLELSGLVADKRPWTLQDLQALPQTSMVIKHICVEGWSYIGGWTGMPLRTFLERVGADLRAKYVAFKTADDYPSSIDMATALHPQTLLAIKYGGRNAGRSVWVSGAPAHGDQARLQEPEVDHGHRGHEHVSRADTGKRKAFHGLRAYEACRLADSESRTAFILGAPSSSRVWPTRRAPRRAACRLRQA